MVDQTLTSAMTPEEYAEELQTRFTAPGPSTGLAGLGPTTADRAITGVPTAGPQERPGLRPVGMSVRGGYDPSQLDPVELAAPLQLPAPLPTGFERPAQPELTQPVIAYSPSTNKLVVNGRVVDANNAMAVAEAAKFIGDRPTPAPGKRIKDWQAVAPEQLTSFVEALSQPRGTFENIALGVSTATESLVGGAGRTLETQFGVPETGRAIAGFAKETFGLTPEQESRNALIQQTNSFAGNLIDAIETGAGSLFVSTLAAALGAVKGGPVGAGVLAGLSIFPMEMYGLYEAAQKNGYNVEDPDIQNRLLNAATVNTVAQSIVPGVLGKKFAEVFRPQLRQVAEEAIAKTARSRALSGAKAVAAGGLTEALAEGTAQFVQSVVFDKELRDKLDPEMQKGLANYLSQAALDPVTYKKYGLDIATAAIAGGALGAGFTAGAVALEPTDLTRRAPPPPEVPDVNKELREADQEPPPPAPPAPQGLVRYRGYARGPSSSAPTFDQIAALNKLQVLQRAGGVDPQVQLLATAIGDVVERDPSQLGAYIESLNTTDPQLVPAATRLAEIITEGGSPPPGFAAELNTLVRGEAEPLPLFAQAPTATERDATQREADYPLAEQQAAELQTINPRALSGSKRPGPRLYIANQFNAITNADTQAQVLAAAEYSDAKALENDLANADNIRIAAIRKKLNNAAAARGLGADYFTKDVPSTPPKDSKRTAGTTAAQPESIVGRNDAIDRARTVAARGVQRRGKARLKKRGETKGVVRGIVTEVIEAGREAGNPLAGFGVQTPNAANLRALAAKIRKAGGTTVPNAPKSFIPSGAKTEYANKLADYLRQNPVIATKLMKGKTRAATQGPQPKSDQPKRTDLKKGRPAAKTGGGDRLKQGRKSTQTKTQETVDAAAAAERRTEFGFTEGVTGPQLETLRSGLDAVRQQEGIAAEPPKIEGSLRSSKVRKEFADKLIAYAIANNITPDALKKAAAPLGKPTRGRALGKKAAPTPAPEPKPEPTPEPEPEPQPITAEKRAAFGVDDKATQQTISDLLQKINEARPPGTPEPPMIRVSSADRGAINEAADRLIRYAEENGIADRLAAPGTSYLDNLIRTKVERGRTFRLPPSVAQQVDTVTDVLDTNNKPVRPMAPGRIRMDVKNFVRKLQRKPKVAVYANQADLKLKAPDIYKRAAASRPGDFDTVNAAAISFGDDIVIFSDRIATPQMLRFVLAHESLGHFGLRSVMPAKDFNAVMELVYNTDSKARDAADARMSLYPDMSKSEAVEEYLADYAASLESNVILRVFNGTKKFLSKLGVGFDDATTRYLLDQSRRYVRYGQDINVAQMSEIVQRAAYIETGAGPAYTGRFAPAGTLNNTMHLAAMKARSNINVFPTDFDSAIKAGKRYLGDAGANLDAVLRKIYRLPTFLANENEGLSDLDRIFQNVRMLAETGLTNAHNRLNSSTFALNPKLHDSFGSLIYAAREHNVARHKFGAEFDKLRLLKVGPDLQYTANKSVFDQLAAMGRVSKKEAYEGFTVQTEVEENGETVLVDAYKFPGLNKMGLSDKDKEQIFKSYNDSLDVLNKMTTDTLIETYRGIYDTRSSKLREISDIMFDGRDLSEQQIAFFDKYTDLYTKLLETSVSDADKLLRQVNQAFLSDPNKIKKGEQNWMETLEQTELVDAKDRDELVKLLKEFKKTSPQYKDAQRFTIQSAVSSLGTLVQGAQQAEKTVKQGIATGHVSLIRDGGYEVRVRAYDPKTGEGVHIPQEVQDRLVYAQFASEKDAMDFADSLNGSFADPSFELPYITDKGVTQRGKFKLRASASATIAEQRASPYQNYTEFKRTLDLMNINLPPQVHEEITKRLTRQGDAVRKRLRAAFTPGADLSLAVSSIADKIKTEANVAAKNRYRGQLEALMNLDTASSRRKWFGDSKKVMDLYTRMQSAKDSENKDLYRSLETEFLIALNRYKNANPAAKGWDGSPGKFRKDYREGDRPDRGGVYHDEARRQLADITTNVDVLETDVLANNKFAASIKALTGTLQLGMVFAQAPMNIASLPTNVLPYLMTRNAETGFGGGFGTKAVMEAFNATLTTGLPRVLSSDYSDVSYFDRLLKNDAELKKVGLTKAEAKYLRDAIASGQLIPAQTNAIIANAQQTLAANPRVRKFIDFYMLPFARSEEMVRRIAGLTAFRLEYNRQIASGKSDADASDLANDFARTTINRTLGEYSFMNRPPAWRHGITSLLFMYKTYPLTTIQLFNNLGRGGKGLMALSLFLLTGLAGMPFAEDLEDLIDTYMQKSGMGASVRLEAAKYLEEIAPGWSPFFLRGLVNQFVPADIASRFSVGDIVPGTSALLAGASFERIAGEVAGPSAAAALGLVATGYDLAAYPFSETKSLSDIARSSPATFGRILGDLYQYNDNGSITDKRGYVVAPDVTTTEMLWRLGGFYPQRAAKQYEIIKYYKRVSDYQRAVSSEFQNAWVRARLAKDPQKAAKIVQNVREWNRYHRGTGLEIGNFMAKAQRRLKLASMPAGQRTLKSLPKNVKAAEDSYIRAMIGEPE